MSTNAGGGAPMPELPGTPNVDTHLEKSFDEVQAALGKLIHKLHQVAPDSPAIQGLQSTQKLVAETERFVTGSTEEPGDPLAAAGGEGDLAPEAAVGGEAPLGGEVPPEMGAEEMGPEMVPPPGLAEGANPFEDGFRELHGEILKGKKQPM